jgi:hypothetical protein
VEGVKTCRPPPPSTSTQCTSNIPKDDSLELAQCRDDVECPLTLQDEPGIIRGRRKQLIYRA